MREADMQAFFGKHLRKNPPTQTEAYELKISKGNSLPYDAVKVHQVKALVEAEKNFYYRITDAPVFQGQNTRFNSPRPFDCFILVNARAFVVIWFYEARTEKVFVKIPIQEFLKKRDTSTRKSITKEEAFAIGELIYVNAK